MSMAQGKANFQQLLAEKENKVIALSGRWGTGKSHLWRQLKAESQDDSINKALYVSLFGLSSITELKLKAAQGVIPVDAGMPMMETMRSFARAATKVAKGFHSSFSALDEIALLAVPKMLEGRFIVIDDIERKHEKLSIDEVLGFIDDFTQNYQCRILLILNTDQLGDKNVWEKFREKVIDQELRLDTSPLEAFDIAIEGVPSKFSAGLRAAVETCEVNNIRIIRKIVLTANRILTARDNLPQEVLNRVIPSTVLMTAIHYKGLDDGPDMEYVLQQNEAFLIARAYAEAAKQDQAETEASKARARWDLLLEKLGINGTDEYEALVARYLNSGQFEATELAKILDRYCSEENLLAAQNRSREFFQRARWQPDLTEAQVLTEATELLVFAHLLSPSVVTSLHEYVTKLPHGEEVAKSFIDKWIEAFKSKPVEEGDADRFEDADMFDRQHHPDIKAAFAEVRAQIHAERTLLEVMVYMSTSSGWGNREESVLKAATVSDFEEAIKGATGQDLKRLLLKSIDLYVHRKTYVENFGSAMDNFLKACKKICLEESGSRRAELLKSVFNGAKVGADLEPAVVAVPLAEPSDSPE